MPQCVSCKRVFKDPPNPAMQVLDGEGNCQACAQAKIFAELGKRIPDTETNLALLVGR